MGGDCGEDVREMDYERYRAFQVSTASGDKPLDAYADLQDRLAVKGRWMFRLTFSLVTVVVPSCLLAWGWILSTKIGDSEPCGVFLERSLPSCRNLSWEFVVGMVVYFFVALTMTYAAFVFLVAMPARIKQRQCLWQERLERE